MTVQSSKQPSIINAVASNVLLFLGLLIAANLAFFMGDGFGRTASWARLAALGSLSAALVGGICALLSNLNSHNLARAEEKEFGSAEEKASRIRSDRWYALSFLAAAIYSGIVSAVAALVLVLVLFWTYEAPVQGTSARGVTIASESGAELLRLEGVLESLQMTPDTNGCRMSAKLGTLSVAAIIDQKCAK